MLSDDALASTALIERHLFREERHMLVNEQEQWPDYAKRSFRYISNEQGPSTWSWVYVSIRRTGKWETEISTSAPFPRVVLVRVVVLDSKRILRYLRSSFWYLQLSLEVLALLL